VGCMELVDGKHCGGESASMALRVVDTDCLLLCMYEYEHSKPIDVTILHTTM
jgi:hypothetical protein